MTKIHKIIFFAIIVITLAFYLSSFDYTFMGSYNDDAWYINAARYLAGSQDIQKELKARNIGYPVLLAPLAGLFPSSITVLRLTSVLAFIIIPFIIFYFLQDIFDPARLLIFIALFSLNATVVAFSTNVMSEAPYLLFLIISIAVFRYYLKEETGGLLPLFILAFISAYLFFLKNQGILVFFSLTAYFIMKRKTKDLIYFALFFLVFMIPVFFLNPIGSYMSVINRTYGHSSRILLPLGNLLYYFKWGIYRGILNIGVGSSSFSSVLFKAPVVYAASTAVFACIVYGLITNREPEYMVPFKIYFILHLSAHIWWATISIRYLMPLLPLSIYYFMSGLSRIGKKAFYPACFIILVSCLSSDMRIAATSLKDKVPSPVRTYSTFRWLKENTPDKSVISSNHPARIYLHTCRKSVVFPGFNTPDELYFNLLTNNIDYVVSFAMEPTHINYERLYTYFSKNSLMRFCLADNPRYEEVFISESENVFIWKVRENLSFRKAWKINADGIKELARGNRARAGEYFTEALNEHSNFPLAAFNLARLLFLEKNYNEALFIVSEALKYSPADKMLLIFRGTIYKETGKPLLAEKDWSAALRIANTLGEKNTAAGLHKLLSGLFPDENRINGQ
ncbi:MAG: tetratricopeptide repeat protein [Elusimicrobiota bacterium]